MLTTKKYEIVKSESLLAWLFHTKKKNDKGITALKTYAVFFILIMWKYTVQLAVMELRDEELDWHLSIMMMWIYTQNITHFFSHRFTMRLFFFVNTYCKLKHDILHSATTISERCFYWWLKKDEWVVIKNGNGGYFTKQKKKKRRLSDNRDLCASPAPANYIERTKFFSLNTERKKNKTVIVLLLYFTMPGCLCNQTVFVSYRVHNIKMT